MRNRVRTSMQRCFSSSGDLVPTIESLEGRLLLAGTPAIVYSGPIVITSGGTYSGNWHSNNPNVAAVTISTTAPVIIDNSNVQSKGDLIATGVSGVNLTVENTNGYGLNPNVAGDSPGRFLDAYNFANIVVEHDYLQSTAGIELDTHQGSSGTVKILDNKALNIDGRISNGAGGWLNYNDRENLSTGAWDSGYNIVQFVQLSNVHAVPGIGIGWNQVINQPGNSRVEDNINIFDSSGTSSSPILIHDNYIQGAYTIDPTQSNYSDGTYYYDWTFSGGGILLGDGGTTTLSHAAGYVQAYNNEVVSTQNYAIAIAAGHDETFYDNQMISSGLLPNGQTMFGTNSGAYIWNSYGVPASVFYNNSGHDNLIGWLQEGAQVDAWVPNATSWTNNKFSGAITLATEASELTSWQNQLVTSHVAIGLL